jgi:protoheme IX farnesyltransferase
MSRAGIVDRTGLKGASVATVGDFVALLKPRVMSLVLFTALVGMTIAPGTLHPLLSATTLLAIALGAGAAGALNMWFDSDIDALMARTCARPVPSGRIAREDALAFGAVLSCFAVLLMALAANPVAAGLLALTIGFYVFVYTMWLKRRTPQNIVIGGAAGALPPLVGWAAVTGAIALPPVVLCLIIFLWTPPHFWALALYRGRDYERAGVPMLPVVAGAEKTCAQIALYTVALVALSFAPVILGFAGGLYAGVGALGGAAFLWLALSLWRARKALGQSQRERKGRQIFGFSILYLALIFGALLAERTASVPPFTALWT